MTLDIYCHIWALYNSIALRPETERVWLHCVSFKYELEERRGEVRRREDRRYTVILLL